MTFPRLSRTVAGALVAIALIGASVGLSPAAGAAGLPAGAATLTGVVTDAAGTPIATAVSACYGTSAFFCSQFASTSSGADGVFQFTGIAGGTYVVTVSVPPAADGGYQLPAAATTSVASTGTTSVGSLALRLGGKVGGQVRLPGGSPVAATVQICDQPQTNPGPCDIASSDAGTGQYLETRATAGPLATVRVTSPPAGYFGVAVTGVPITPGATTAGVDLVLDPGGTVQGTVRGPGGEAVAGATVSVGSIPAACSPCSPPVSTALDGTFSLPAPTGPVSLSVTPPAGTSYVAVANVGASVPTGGTATVAVTLQRASTVVGTIASVNGALASINAIIACTSPNVINTVSPSASAPCMRPDTTPAAAAGQFGSNAAPGTYQVNAVPAPARYNLYGVSITNFGVPFTFVSSPAAIADVAPGDVVTCQFVVDMDTTGTDQGSSTCSGATGTPPGGGNTATVPVPGGGTTTIASPSGTTLSGVTAVDPTTVGGGVLPAGVTLPYGAFSFTVTGVAVGGTADVTLTYPALSPAPNGYAKLVGGAWQDASSLVVPGSATAGSITIRLTDGGSFDTDPRPGIIGDPGGPAVVTPPITGTFRSPVDGLPALNTGRAGRAYPVKFTLVSGATPVTALSAVLSTTYRSVSCTQLPSTLTDALEVETPGASSLTVINGVFQLNWATPPNPGCYRLTVTFADRATLVANFKLR